MSANEAIGKLIAVATSEIGYLEKKSNSQLDNKTANAGSNNYTKYWRDVYPQFQGQAWCAAFVTWCMVKAFGQDNAKRLLKHYPYVYCPTLGNLFERNANPKRGDIVLFYNKGTFTHTGIVVSVNGDLFTTIEGNTSGGSTIIANGGGVCKKSYYNSKLPGTKFVSPDYSLIEPISIKEYTDAESIAWELHYRGVVEDKSGLIDECQIDPSGRIYWLARKLCHAIRQAAALETVTVVTYTDIGSIAWDLNHRGIAEDKQGLIDEVKAEPNGRLYWLARKGLDYLRRRD